ncbi:MAG: hypothetical protein ACYDH9_05135 [Limisphaerales bacterium]
MSIMLKPRLVISFVTLALVGVAGALAWRALRPSPRATATDPAKVFRQRFQTRIWPLLTRGGDHSCVHCHDAENESDLHFLDDAESSFQMLVEKGYFAPNLPDSLLGRLTSAHPKRRMPKGAQPWTGTEIDLLRAFLSDLNREFKIAGQADERFPTALVTAYHGPVPRSLDNQFISYRQLRGKIQTVFHDDWVRNGRDLFQENIALFNGADFKERFNESTKASATFLTGLAMLSRDVASRAYTLRSGPFAGRPDHLPSPLGMNAPDAAYREGITRLYTAILFRPPMQEEIQQAFTLLQNVYRNENEIRGGDYELTFKLTASDASTGRTSTRTLSIPVSGESHGLYQELISQSASEPEAKELREETKATKRRDRKVSGRIARQKLSATFQFQPDDPGQCCKISNVNTVGNVSFQAIEIQPADSAGTNLIRRITAADPSVQPEGAWKIEDGKGITSFEDENNDKGGSTITVPITVPKAGRYTVTVCWRASNDNADGVLVEVLSAGPDHLAKPSLAALPPKGEAHYFIDESVDTIAFADLEAEFQFGPDDFVEINNQGTHRRVTADAVKFSPTDGQPAFLVDNDEADGREKWAEYHPGEFEAYNKVGKNTYHDENAHKGELYLRYRPSLKSAWKAGQFYRLLVGYPAKGDHEIRTPVIVKARQSSPILQIAYPARARADAAVEIDASGSFTVQRSELGFSWEQLDGPVLRLKDPHAPVLRFVAPRSEVEPAAWVGLCQALMRHPDFLFTRPPSLQVVNDPREKQRLQLMKIALDLLGRPPSKWELAKLAEGTTLPGMIDLYLQTKEFQDFYFQRIRLYVESHGTATQDEPARLWCYVAFHDRPFQEILTASYTVDPQWRRQPRPPYYGRTGVLTTHGFIEGKPGLPHFNYAAQVAELFLGYVFEVPPEVVKQRENATAASTTDPNSVCYSCHKILTPLAFQRTRWDDDGNYHLHDDEGRPIDDSDNRLVAAYPFAGEGLEAFATQAVKKERFIRAMINTHFTFYFGRSMRYEEDERVLYRRMWDAVRAHNFTIRGLIKAMLTSPEYLEGQPPFASTKEQIARPDPKPASEKVRVAAPRAPKQISLAQ